VTDEVSMTFGPLVIWYDAEGLRPRPWTRRQSAWAAELLGGLPEGDVLELCAGVGQIGLLALVEADRDSDTASHPRRRLVQIGAEATSCRLAEQNAHEAGYAERVAVRRGVPEDVLRPGERFVLILADPPWVPHDRVSDYPDDPAPAIDGGSDGLDVVRALLPVIEGHLHASGAALLQVGGPDQVTQVRDLLEKRPSALRLTDFREAPGANDGAVALLVHRHRTTT
jgi:methylase of polypeptide subunit release factors